MYYIPKIEGKLRQIQDNNYKVVLNIIFVDLCLFLSQPWIKQKIKKHYENGPKTVIV